MKPKRIRRVIRKGRTSDPLRPDKTISPQSPTRPVPTRPGEVPVDPMAQYIMDMNMKLIEKQQNDKDDGNSPVIIVNKIITMIDPRTTFGKVLLFIIVVSGVGLGIIWGLSKIGIIG